MKVLLPLQEWLVTIKSQVLPTSCVRLHCPCQPEHLADTASPVWYEVQNMPHTSHEDLNTYPPLTCPSLCQVAQTPVWKQAGTQSVLSASNSVQCHWQRGYQDPWGLNTHRCRRWSAAQRPTCQARDEVHTVSWDWRDCRGQWTKHLSSMGVLTWKTGQVNNQNRSWNKQSTQVFIFLQDLDPSEQERGFSRTGLNPKHLQYSSCRLFRFSGKLYGSKAPFPICYMLTPTQ